MIGARSRLNAADWDGPLPMLPEGDAIPRVIHQTYPVKTLPPLLQDAVDRLRGGNPQWQHHLYDDGDVRDFIGLHYDGRVLAAYNRIDPAYGAARADLFRYLLLYRLGGVYLDIKSGCGIPLDDLLLPGDRYLLSFWHREDAAYRREWGLHSELAHVPDGEFQQWYIACAPGHPFLRAVLAKVLQNLEEYRPFTDGIGRSGVLRVTGPIAYTLAIEPILQRHAHRWWENHERAGLIYNCVNPGEAEFYKTLFPSHYTTCNRPVVQCGPATTLAVMAAVNAKRTGRRLIRGLARRNGSNP
jgi:hypothetical protein